MIAEECPAYFLTPADAETPQNCVITESSILSPKDSRFFVVTAAQTITATKDQPVNRSDWDFPGEVAASMHRADANKPATA